MKKFRLFAALTLAAGIAAAGTTTLSAQDWHDANRPDLNAVQYRSHHRDYDRIGALRNEISRDRARLMEDRRHGNRFAAALDERALARDQHELDVLLRTR